MIILGRSWGRGVVVNMRPCQGRDRGFESRRSRHKYLKKAALRLFLLPVFEQPYLEKITLN